MRFLFFYSSLFRNNPWRYGKIHSHCNRHISKYKSIFLRINSFLHLLSRFVLRAGVAIHMPPLIVANSTEEITPATFLRMLAFLAFISCFLIHCSMVFFLGLFSSVWHVAQANAGGRVWIEVQKALQGGAGGFGRGTGGEFGEANGTGQAGEAYGG